MRNGSNVLQNNADDITNSLEQCEPSSEPKFGFVINCKFLNVFEAPNKNADILAKLIEGAKVMVDFTESTDEFHSVFTETGVEGYSMKQFIEV